MQVLAREQERGRAVRGVSGPAARRGLAPPAAPRLRRPQRRDPATTRRRSDAACAAPERPEPDGRHHHHHQAELPPVLHLRAGLPGQGHPHRGRPGLGGGRALHQLRQLHHGLLAGRQGLRERHRRRPVACSTGSEVSAAALRLLAPSFPVGFSVPPAQVIGALRAAGFTYVVEVAYGADLVNEACHEYLRREPDRHSTSPAPARRWWSTCASTIPS